jgi:hypothetical protein
MRLIELAVLQPAFWPKMDFGRLVDNARTSDYFTRLYWGLCVDEHA